MGEMTHDNKKSLFRTELMGHLVAGVESGGRHPEGHAQHRAVGVAPLLGDDPVDALNDVCAGGVPPHVRCQERGKRIAGAVGRREAPPPLSGNTLTGLMLTSLATPKE